MIEVGLFLLFCTGALAAGPDSSGKPCSNVKGVMNFDPKSGLWFEIEKSSQTLWNERKCVAVRYTPRKDGVIDAIFWYLPEKRKNLAVITGNYTYNSKVKEAIMTANFPVIPVQQYKILEIDYKNYFVIFACTKGANDVVIFSRQLKLSDASKKGVETVLTKYNLKSPPLKKTSQENCPGSI